MSELRIFDVVIKDNISDQLKDLPEVQAKIQALSTNILTKVTDSCLATAREHVPVDTGELQTKDIKPHIYKSNKEAKVMVMDVTHLGRFKRPVPAPELAALLNTSPLRRSKDRSRTTQNWIEDAQTEVENNLDSIVQGVVDGIF